MTVKLLTEHNWEFVSLKGGCTASSEYTLVKMPNLFEITCHRLIMSEVRCGNNLVVQNNTDGYSTYSLKIILVTCFIDDTDPGLHRVCVYRQILTLCN